MTGEERLPAESGGDAPAPAPRRRVRRVLGPAGLVPAALLLLAALTLPDDYGRLGPGAFARLPVEALVAVAVLVLLPDRPRRMVAATLGALVGLLALVKLVDIGFTAVLARPFDPVLDWGLLGAATGVVEDSVGRAGAVGAVLGLLLVVVAVVGLTTLSALRLSRVAAGHRTAALRAVAVLAAGWVALAAFGVPAAAHDDSTLAYERARAVRAALQDRQAFRVEAAVDPFRDVPADQLLTGLRGRDVVLTFVESYGRSALADRGVTAVLDSGTRTLARAGYAARSGFLTSSTVGGGSWLAHSTLLSGLWIDNQQRYRTLVAGDRLTLPAAFARAGWHTVGVEPAVDRAWPEGRFFGYSTAYDSRTLGYAGPRFSYATMPDQYTFAAFQRLARGPGHAPVLAGITLVSSHSPWTPIPTLVGWDAVGDGSVFGTARTGGPPGSILADPPALRTAYRESIAYSLSTVISYLQRYGGRDLVLVFLGDHQPAPVITGPDAGRDVPVTIVADPAVLARVAGWGWTPGLRPAAGAPTWRMDAFRDRFLTAFGPGPAR